MNEALDHKCPSCNAILKYNPHGDNFKCEYCKSEFTLEEVTDYNKKRGNTLDKEIKYKDLDMYICSNCGAKIITDENTSATSCVYCKNTSIMRDKLIGEFSPQYIIPFKNTKEDAINAFKALGKGKPFIPKDFKRVENINEMSGVYIPFWLYDFSVDGELEATGNRVTSWKSGNYRYTKTDTYSVTRGGNISFEKIPTDGSKRFENDIMNSIEPFDYTGLKKFNFSYLSGFLSEKYDVTKDEAKAESKSRAEASFVDSMRNDIRGYTSVINKTHKVTFNEEKSNYVLLPVWMLNIKYKDKIYTFAMNGQTGKLIGNIPVNKAKAFFTWLGLVILIFLIVYVINYAWVIL